MTKRTEVKYIVQVKRYKADKWHNLISYYYLENAKEEMNEQRKRLCYDDVRIIKATITTITESEIIKGV